MSKRWQCGLAVVLLGLPVRAAPVAALAGQATEANPDSVPGPVDARIAAMLDRAGRYVVEYERVFRDLVAEETSTQWAGDPGASADSRHPRRRTLRSEMVFTTLPGALPWGCFRDVFEVDGQKVHDREGWLERLFVHGSSASAIEHASAILEESSRYNIGTARRTANVPTYPLLFLHPSNQARFRFEIKGRRQFHDQEGRELHFTEIARPTLLKGRGVGLPATGSFWVAEQTGVVLRSDVTYEFPPRRATAWVALDYRPEPGLHIWVPEEMKERYEDLPYAVDREFGERTEATSRYSNYRRFTVTTKEEVVVVP